MRRSLEILDLRLVTLLDLIRLVRLGLGFLDAALGLEACCVRHGQLFACLAGKPLRVGKGMCRGVCGDLQVVCLLVERGELCGHRVATLPRVSGERSGFVGHLGLCRNVRLAFLGVGLRGLFFLEPLLGRRLDVVQMTCGDIRAPKAEGGLSVSTCKRLRLSSGTTPVIHL